VADYRKVLGEDHPLTLTTMNNLATTRRNLGDLDGARQLQEQVLAGRRRVLGDDHPETLTSINKALPLLPWVMRAVSVVAGTGRRR
jgi:hypothetical protein